MKFSVYSIKSELKKFWLFKCFQFQFQVLLDNLYCGLVVCIGRWNNTVEMWCTVEYAFSRPTPENQIPKLDSVGLLVSDLGQCVV